MDRKSLKRQFTLEWAPAWVCPTCEKGTLILQKDSMQKGEAFRSRDHYADGWDPEYIEYVYSCLFVCSNLNCQEVVASTGKGGVDWVVEYNEDGQPEGSTSNFFIPRFFEPPLRIIPIPKKCPDSVRMPLIESFTLLFSSPSSSANSVRIALENLLTELKIRRYKIVKSKRRIITLHERIEKIPEKYSDVKDLIYAVKWIGNAGSHDSSVITLDDVFDSYEMIADILKEIYEPKRRATLKAMAKKINKKRGPC